MATTTPPDLIIPGIGRVVKWWCERSKTNTGDLRSATELSEADYAQFLEGKQGLLFSRLMKLAGAMKLTPEQLLAVAREFATSQNIKTPILNAITKAGKRPLKSQVGSGKVPRSTAAVNAVSRYYRGLALSASKS